MKTALVMASCLAAAVRAHPAACVEVDEWRTGCCVRCPEFSYCTVIRRDAVAVVNASELIETAGDLGMRGSGSGSGSGAKHHRRQDYPRVVSVEAIYALQREIELPCFACRPLPVYPRFWYPAHQQDCAL